MNLSLSDWGIIVAILSAAAAGIVWLWKNAVRRFLLWTHRVFADAALRAELEDIRDSKRAVQTLGRQHAQMLVDIEAMKPQVACIPLLDERTQAHGASLARIEKALNDLLLQLSASRKGGQRRTDPR